MRFTIIGDSWACGEWRGHGRDGKHRTGDMQLNHWGVAQCLHEAGHDVMLMARGGASNLEAAEGVRLDHDEDRWIRPHREEWWQRGPRWWLSGDRPAEGGHPFATAHCGDCHPRWRASEADVIIWFLTDPFRDFPEDLRQQGEGIPVHTLPRYHHLQRRMMYQQLDRVHDIRPHGVWLVGGVGPVPQDAAQRYPGWRVVVPDLTRWLIPASTVSGPHLCRGWEHVDCDPALLEFHRRQEHEVLRHWRNAQNDPGSAEQEWFWPDGRHPNRRAHERLWRERIQPMILRS